MKTTQLCFLIIALGLTGLAPIAFAQPTDAGAVLVDAGLGSGSVITADDLDDPVLAPAAAYDDARALHKIGWPLLLLGLLIMAAKGLQSAGKRWPWKWLAWLNAGYRATAIAGTLTVGAAAFNSLALGGTWFAVLTAAGAALLALVTPAPKEPVP